MKNILIPLAIILVLFLIGTQLLRSPAGTGAALKIAATTVTSTKHHGPLFQCGRYAMSATHNHQVIARAAEYAGDFGSNTSMYLLVAETAAGLDRECPDLERVLDLTAMCVGNADAIRGLLSTACRTESPEEQAEWERLYAALWERAEYPDVESAVAARGGS